MTDEILVNVEIFWHAPNRLYVIRCQQQFHTWCQNTPFDIPSASKVKAKLNIFKEGTADI